jgi:3-hydroxyisobutyrate dehydrogenase-like beta-hydroxyacid dehydrogenase
MRMPWLISSPSSALEGERKQVTVLFADLKGSMELLAERDPEEARQLLDPVLAHMMAAVHCYEGTVNQVLGDGIMALFGAPLAHADHAVRACYAALAMQEALHHYAEEVRRAQGLLVQMCVGLNSGEVVVRAIGNDLHMDYSANWPDHAPGRAPGALGFGAAALINIEDEDSTMQTTVGIVGLGNAGSAMATALSGKMPLVGFDANPERRHAVAHLALEWVPSLAQLANRVGTVVLSLPKPEISRAVVTELVQGAKVPELIIETSTITPQVAQELGAICQAGQVRFIDAAIANGVASMAAGKITFLVGGEPDDVARAHPALEGMAEAIMHLGPVGAGMGAKVVVNAVAHAVMVVLIEAGAMATKLGLPMQTLVDILRRPEGLIRPLTHRVQERMMQGDYTGGMSVSNARKDSTLALQTAQELGVPLYAIQASHTPYEIAEALGMGQFDYAALATLWEQWTDIQFAPKTQ